MIYMEPESLGVDPLIESWLATIPANLSAFSKFSARLRQLFKAYIEDTLWFLRRNVIETVTTMNNSLISSQMRLLMSFFRGYEETELKKVAEEDMSILDKALESLFIFTLIWSVGCTGDYDGRVRFDEFIRDKVAETSPSVELPEAGLLYEYEFDIPSMAFIKWSERNKEFAIDSKAQYHEIMIPTTDSTRNIFITKLLLTNSFHVLTPGPTGNPPFPHLS